MTDTVDTAASPAPAGEAEEPRFTVPADGGEQPGGAAPTDEAQQPPDQAAPSDEAEQPPDQAAPSDEAEEAEEAPSVTELVVQLSRELGELGLSEAQLEAARNMPEVRRTARDIAGAVVVAVAALTAFALLNVGAVIGLSKVLSTWLAALLLAGGWLVVSGLLLFGLMGRARRWLFWILLKAPPKRAVKELEQERDAAGRAARGTLEQLGPALALQIALAAIPKAGEVAGDVAGGVVEVSDTVLEASDEFVEEITEELPGGGAINQVWDLALMPGRLGIRVATTVLRRGRPADDQGSQDAR